MSKALWVDVCCCLLGKCSITSLARCCLRGLVTYTLSCMKKTMTVDSRGWWHSPRRGRTSPELWRTDGVCLSMFIHLSMPIYPENVGKFAETAIVHGNVNVNVNLYSASSQEAPLMRSMCRALIKKTRLQCTTKTVSMHVRLTQIVLEQVPCRWSSDSEGVTAVSIELKPWNNE